MLALLMEAEREIAAVRAEDTYPFYELLHHVAARIAHTEAFYICLYSAADETLFFSYNFDNGIYDHPETIPAGQRSDFLGHKESAALRAGHDEQGYSTR